VKRNDEKRRQAQLLHVQGLSYTEIGKRMNFSRQHAQQLVRPPKRIYDLIKKRAGGKCENCGIPVSAGHIHHMTVASPSLENFNDKRRLRYLCPSCHATAHDQIGSGKLGAEARNKKLSPARRKQIAKDAANTRWAGERERRITKLEPVNT